MSWRRITHSSLTACLLLTYILLSPCSRVHAQGITTGTVAGTIADPQGAVIAHAAVTAVEDASHVTLKTETSADGSFVIHDVPIGTYTLSVQSSGFTPLRINSVRVSTGITSQLGTQQLAIGATSAVTVESTAPILNTQEAQVTTEFDSVAVQSLPLNTNFDNLALLAPGVVETHDAQFSNSNGVGISANGQRGRSNNFEIDGQNNNDNNVGGPQVFFGNGDALSEIQIITNNFGAQYGRNMGSVVNYVTKSGSNSFHGSGFEYYTGSWVSSLQNGQKTPLDGFCAPGQDPASGCVTAVVPRSVDNKFGGTLGGPVLKDHLWFFGSTYWDRTRNGGSVATSEGALTPTPTGLAALQSAFPGNPAVASLVNQGPFGIKVGTPSVVSGSTVTQQVSDGSIAVPVEFGQVARNVPALLNDQEHLGRLDWQPRAADHFFLRYFYQDTLLTGSLENTPTTIASGGYVDSTETAHTVGADWTHTFSPAWVNQLRYGFEQAKSYFQGGGLPDCVTTNFTACTPPVTFQDGSDFAYGYPNNAPQAKIIKVTQVQDNANWTHGQHSFGFGGEFDYQNSPSVYLPFYNGNLTFQDFDSFIQGQNGFLNLTDGNPVIPLTESDVALYFQDDWKVRPNLTFNLGLRWEFFGQAVNELHDSTLKRERGPNPFWNSSLPLSITTFQKQPNNWKDIQPRIGFAWNPSGGHVVVRGGYAINHDAVFYNIFNNAAVEAPVANAGGIACGAGYQCIPAGGTTGATIRAQNLAALPVGGDPRFDIESPLPPHLYNPYTQTYSLGVQFGIGKAAVAEIRYVGNHTSRLYQALDGNPMLQPLASAFPNYISPTALCQDSAAPGYLTRDCHQGALQALTSNTAFSIYNGLQTSFTTRELHGLTGTLQYTYSRTIDNASEILPTAAGGQTLEYAQNPLDSNLGERGVSGISYPNVFSFGFVYQVPDLVQRRNLIGKVARGYSINTIYEYNSGQPFTPYQGIPANGSYCDGLFNVSVLGVDSCRPVLLNRGAPNSPASYVVNDIPLADRLGNPFPGIGRNTVRGQSYNNLDASIFKTTAMTDRINLQLQLNAFNVLNRQFLGTPGAFIGAPNFLSTAFNQGTNRTLQIAGKIIF